MIKISHLANGNSPGWTENISLKLGTYVKYYFNYPHTKVMHLSASYYVGMFIIIAEIQQNISHGDLAEEFSR